MGVTIECKLHLRVGRRGRKQASADAGPAGVAPADAGVVPRLSRLMALAIRLDRLVAAGLVKDYADLARLGGVTRARMTQIMNLLNLASDIQEAILFQSRVAREKDALPERRVRAVAAEAGWGRQREKWLRLTPGTRLTQ